MLQAASFINKMAMEHIHWLYRVASREQSPAKQVNMCLMLYIYFRLQECKNIEIDQDLRELQPFNIGCRFLPPQMECDSVFSHSVCMSLYYALTFVGLYLESLFWYSVSEYLSQVSYIKVTGKKMVFCVSCLLEIYL